jgi:uncharacterized protein (DUF1810 family)
MQARADDPYNLQRFVDAQQSVFDREFDPLTIAHLH